MDGDQEFFSASSQLDHMISIMDYDDIAEEAIDGQQELLQFHNPAAEVDVGNSYLQMVIKDTAARSSAGGAGDYANFNIADELQKLVLGGDDRRRRDLASSTASYIPAASVDPLVLLESVVNREYREDLHKNSKLYEIEINDYIIPQLGVKEEMRSFMVNWVITGCNLNEQTPETLYLSVNIIDRYLSSIKNFSSNLPLLAATAMFIASKYEEEDFNVLLVDDLVFADSCYRRKHVLRMEKKILDRLNWELSLPTQYPFLVKYMREAQCDKKTEHMVLFFAELGLMEYSMIKLLPSLFAASCVHAAHCTLSKLPLWSERLSIFTGFSEHQLWTHTLNLLKAHSNAGISKLRNVYCKYSREEFGGVALLPPVNNLSLSFLSHSFLLMREEKRRSDPQYNSFKYARDQGSRRMGFYKLF